MVARPARILGCLQKRIEQFRQTGEAVYSFLVTHVICDN